MILAYVDNCGTQSTVWEVVPHSWFVWMLSLWTHNWLCLSSFAIHLLACYRWSRPSFFFMLHNWANPFQVDFLCKPFESSLSLIPWTLSIVKILTNLLWAWERKWLIVMSWFKFGGIIVDTREHEKNCKFFSSIQFNSKKKRKLMQASWELVSFVQ